jgi:hypothetical protein
VLADCAPPAEAASGGGGALALPPAAIPLLAAAGVAMGRAPGVPLGVACDPVNLLASFVGV